MKKTDRNFFLGGGIAAAVAASLCCILPVLSIAFGLGAFGAAAFFESLRPYLLTLVVLALAFSFYQMYFRRETCAEGEVCATKPFVRTNKILLWVLAIAIGVIAMFPHYSEYIVAALINKPKPPVESIESNAVGENQQENAVEKRGAINPSESQNQKTTVIAVKGMTCEGCASHINVALMDLKGVISAEANYREHNVTIVYDPQEVTLERIKKGINDTGYIAK